MKPGSADRPNARLASRSPRLLPSAIAILVECAPLLDVTDKADRHDHPAVIVDLERLADQFAIAARRLLEQALVLEHLAEDHLEHALLARVADRFDPRPPLLDEAGIGR